MESFTRSWVCHRIERFDEALHAERGGIPVPDLAGLRRTRRTGLRTETGKSRPKAPVGSKPWKGHRWSRTPYEGCPTEVSDEFDLAPFWIHFTDDRASRPVKDAELDAVIAELVEAGEVEDVTFVVGGPF